MDARDELRELAQDADHAATDAENFAGTAVQYAKDSDFKMFGESIDRAIAMAETLPHSLRTLKRFIQQHPELDKGGF